MKTLICIPAMDTVPTQFAQSLAMLRKDGDVALAVQMSSLIYASRNDLAAQAIHMDADLTLWLDSDMVFEPDLLQRLIETKKKTGAEIVTAVCFRRRPPYSPTLFKTLDINPVDQTAKHSGFDEIPNEPFEVEGCGMAVALIETGVFYDVMAKFGNCFAPIGSNGEDAAFCWRARQCGNRIFADPGPRIGHVGNLVITRDIWEATKNGGNI